MRHGRLDGDVWHKTVRASVHMLRVPMGWAVDVGDLTRAEAAGARFVALGELESLAEFWAATSVIWARGFAFERGAGRQLGLTLGDWRPSRAEAEALADALGLAEGRQLELWGR